VARLPEEEFPALVVASVPLFSAESSVAPADRSAARSRSEANGFVDVVRDTLVAQGFVRFLRGGDVPVRVEDIVAEDLSGGHLDIVVDRWSRRPPRARAADSLRQALRIGRGAARLIGSRSERRWSEGLRCSRCDATLPRPTPGLFSFNTPYGACARCRGFGRVIGIDWDLVVPDKRRSIRRGAVRPLAADGRGGWRRELLRACATAGIDVDVPWSELAERDRDLVLFGGANGWPGVQGFFEALEEKKYKMHVRVLLARYRGYFTCPDCDGGRLRPEASIFRVAGLTLPELWRLPVRDSLRAIEEVAKADLERPVRLVVDEILSRLRYLDQVGLEYLTLDRQSRTLSGGEVERVNLTAALGASLVDTLFVLDEPPIGPHARDNDRLLGILREVRGRGNTVVVVEHDLDILSAADFLIDLGPGSGARGGEIVASGSVAEVSASPASATGAWLRGERIARDAAQTPSRADDARVLRVHDARENNLKGVDVDIPLSGWTAVTGVSGSGKSTLVEDVIWRSWLRHVGEPVEGEVRGAVDGLDLVDEIVLVDESPIGPTPRGNALTCTKVFEVVRRLFGETESARAAGFTASDFSFNSGRGRCPECGGVGFVQVEMQFLSDVSMPCETCGGKRFREALLAVRHEGRSIADVLDLTIDEAAELFASEPAIREP